MSIELYIAFILASALLALTPGPIVSLVIANGTTFGTRAALQTVAGSASGIGLLVAAAALGMTSVMAFMAEWFDWIRWAGAAYLVWLGLSRLWQVWRRRQPAMPAQTAVSGRDRWYWQGLAAAFINPKLLLFLGAFFPQFVNPQAAAGPQLAMLAAGFLVTAITIDSGYALLAGTARGWFTEKKVRIAESFSGALLICAGVWLALARRA